MEEVAGRAEGAVEVAEEEGGDLHVELMSEFDDGGGEVGALHLKVMLC